MVGRAHPGIARWLLGAVVTLFLAFAAASGQQVHRNGFELQQPVWVKGAADAPYEEKSHTISDLTAHDGKRSESIVLDVKAGTFINYQYPTGKALVGEDLSAAVWFKANRPGIQLIAHIILPNERDPKNQDNLVTTVLRGDQYTRVGQWQRLTIGRPVQLARQQQQTLQASLNRQLNFADAYVDNLVLNLYAGPGPTEVWIDDLEIGPIVADSPFKAAVRPGSPAVPGQPTSLPRQPRGPLIEFKDYKILVNNKPVFFRGARFTDTSVGILHDAGFNTVFFDSRVTEPLLREAADKGMYVSTEIPLLGDDGKPLPPDAITRQLNRYAGNDSLLFVRYNGMLTFNQTSLVDKANTAIRAIDPSRIRAADVWDGMGPYSRSVNLVGIHRWPLMTTMELPQYREWLDMRRRLAVPGIFTWSWIQTHMPEWYTQLLYGQSATTSFKEPVGPQPEQIRLLTYCALASGCRGLAFYSDRFLADSHQGRDRLLSCALLNQEMDMLEPLLVTVTEPPEWLETSDTNVKAAVLRCGQGTLVLPMWLGPFGQFVPGQAAATKLSIVVPEVPQGTQAWEVSPAQISGVKAERVSGGTKVTLREFGLTAAIVFTADTAVVARFQDQARNRRQRVAQWSYDMAEYELTKAQTVQKELDDMNRTLPDSQQLLQDAQKRLKQAKELWEKSLFPESYLESQRALRPVRILQRAQWEKAVRGLDSPVTSPYAVSFYTLPRHWRFMEEVRAAEPGANVLTSGGFEREPSADEPSWVLTEVPTPDDIEMFALRVGRVEPPKEIAKSDKYRGSPYLFKVLPMEGKRSVMLQIRPKGTTPPQQALDRAMIALQSPPVNLPPGTLVQISVWMDIPNEITASPDGALFYDSAGGEPLGLRMTAAMGWKKFTIYRRVPASGTLQITLALTGLGSVLFDDIQIRPLWPANSPEAQQARNKAPTRTPTP